MLKFYYKIKWLAILTIFGLGLLNCAERNPADSGIQRPNNNGGGQTSSFWKKTYGPAHAYSMLITPEGFFFAGTQNGHIYYSFDTGQSWGQRKVADDEIIAIARHHNGNLFAASPKEVFTSTNNGNNWTTKGITNLYIASLAINQSGRIYLGTSDGIYQSTDLGESWIKLGLINNWINDIDFSPAGNIYVSTSNGVYYSTDNGSTWILSGLENFWINTLYLDNGGILYAGTSGSGVFCSLNSGLNWDQNSDGLYNGYVNAIIISEQHRIFAGSDGSVYEYIQGINRWKLVESDPLILPVSSLVIDSNGFLFAASPSGIYRSVNSTGLR